MPWIDAFAPAEAVHKARVMQETWGHLYPNLGSEHQGHVDFTVGGFQAGQPVNYDFGDLPSSPVLFEDVFDFLFKKLFNGGEWERLEPGLYRWDGVYKKFKNENCAFVKGTVKQIYKFT